MLRLDQINQNSVLSFWFDTGAMGCNLCYARVLKLGKVGVKVRFENGCEAWRRPHHFDGIVSDQDVAGLIADGVKI